MSQYIASTDDVDDSITAQIIAQMWLWYTVKSRAVDCLG